MTAPKRQPKVMPIRNPIKAVLRIAETCACSRRGARRKLSFAACQSGLQNELEAFDRFPLAGLALLSLKNETKAQTEEDLRRLISAAADNPRERARRERLLEHLGSTEKAEPLELAKYSYERTRNLACGIGGWKGLGNSASWLL